MAEDKDKKEREDREKAGAGGANLGMILGMFVTLALAMGGFTVFIQTGPGGGADPERPAAGEGEIEPAPGGSGKQEIWVKVQDMAFTFNDGGRRRGRKALAKEIVFTLGYGGDRQGALRESYGNLLSPADGDGFFCLKEDSKEGRDFRNMLREFLMSKREEDFAAPDSERLVAGELRVHLQNHIKDLMPGGDRADPYLGTVPYCDLKVQFY